MNQQSSRVRRIALAACAAALAAGALNGCAQMPAGSAGPAAAQSDGAARQASGGEVFGRIVFVIDGKEKDWGTGFFSDGFALAVRSLDRDEVKGYRIKGDGSFAWTLPPGRYVIAAYRQATTTGRLWVQFQVPQAGHATYIGDLRIVTDKSRFRFGVEDAYDAGLARNAEALRAAGLTPDKQLMQTEPPLGSFDSVWGVCAARGGLQCSSGLLGVEPLLAGSTSSHPAVDSLTPLLEWKPSSRADMRYDVAVYETVSLSSMDFGIGSQRGPLVAYAQGLSEPRYRVPTPLQPGREYDWSVRLRDGDSVSSWSTSGYFAFFVIGYVSQHGRWFGFTTPAAR